MNDQEIPSSPAGVEVPRFPGYVVIRERHLVLVKFGKTLSIQDIKSYASALRLDSAFDEKFSEIVDLTAVENVNLSAAHALDLADVVDPFSRSAKRAFVAQTGPQIHAVRMHQILRNDNTNTQIFGSVADAERWIASRVELHSKPVAQKMKTGATENGGSHPQTRRRATPVDGETGDSKPSRLGESFLREPVIRSAKRHQSN